MKVADAMTRDVLTVDADASLKDAAGVLVEHHVTGVPVVDVGGNVLGVLSEADIVAKEAAPRHHRRGALAWLLDPIDPWVDGRAGARLVKEAMSAPAITIRPGAPLSEAAASMIESGVNRLPVVDDDGTLVGIVTRSDLVRAFTRPDGEIAREITHDVVERIFWLDPTQLAVTVDRGNVVLAGAVETETDATLLPEIVRRVPGVVSVSATIEARQARV
jgi:CBS domain-containing protein